MIIIFAVEGAKSNTEVNFFNGLAFHCNNLNLKIYPFEKVRKSIKRENDITGRIKQIMQEHVEYIQDIKFFFIGDGDAKDDFPAMNNTRDIILRYLIDKLKIDDKQIDDQVLKHIPYSFENSYSKMTNGYFPPNAKKSTQKGIFDLFAEQANWFKKNDNWALNYSKIIKDMEKTKNPHEKIMKKIEKREK